MAEMTARPGMLLGIGRFYHDPRGSVRAVRSTQPRESTMLAWLMIGLAIVLLGQLVALSAQVPVGSEAFLPRAGAAVFSLIFLAPLVWYALAAMATLVARAFRGDGSWRDGRLAVFWANLVAAPVQAISIVGAELVEGMGAIASTVVSHIGPLFFAWALAQCIAEAFRFTRTWAVFAVLGVVVLALVALPIYM